MRRDSRETGVVRWVEDGWAVGRIRENSTTGIRERGCNRVIEGENVRGSSSPPTQTWQSLCVVHKRMSALMFGPFNYIHTTPFGEREARPARDGRVKRKQREHVGGA